MKKVISFKKPMTAFWILCFTLLIPLPGACNTAKAASTVSVNVTTEEKQSEIKLNVKKKTLVKETSFSLVLYNLNDSYKVNFKSSDNSIASVDNDGVVTAIDCGDTTITVTVKDGSKTVQTLSCDVTVGVAALGISCSQSSTGITLVVGKSSLLDTILTPSTTVEEAKFYSLDTSIATVSSSGRVTAKSAGTTSIICTIANGTKVKVDVAVSDKEKEKNKEKEKDAVPSNSPAPSSSPVPSTLPTPALSQTRN